MRAKESSNEGEFIMKKNVLLRYRISLVIAAALLSAQASAADTPSEKELSGAIISAIKEDLKPSMLAVLSASELSLEKEFAVNFKKVMDALAAFRKKYPQITGDTVVTPSPAVVPPPVATPPVVTPPVPPKAVPAPAVSAPAQPKLAAVEIKKADAVAVPPVKEVVSAKEISSASAPIKAPAALEPVKVAAPEADLGTDEDDQDLNMPAILNLPGLGVMPTIPTVEPQKTAENDESFNDEQDYFNQDVAISLAMNKILSLDEDLDGDELQGDNDSSVAMLADASDQSMDDEFQDDELSIDEDLMLAMNDEDFMDENNFDEESADDEDLMLALNDDPESLDEEFASLDDEMLETEEPLLTLAQNDSIDELDEELEISE